MKKIIIIIGILMGVVVLAGVIKFNILSGLDGYDVDGNKIKTEEVVVDLGYYEKLRKECQIKNSKSCCLASVDAMEQDQGVLFPQHGVFGCKDGFEREMMNCLESFAWCKPIKSLGNESNSNQDISETTICTADVKQCSDGTFVGRTGPKCEFAKCPGKKLPHLEPGYVEPAGIKLPDNVITEKDCAAAGGEVWNTLGETTYNGELIGKIEGLRCPCACLVRSEDSDIIWVNVNGNLEEFKGNLDDIKTYVDCKKAGFKIRDSEPEICTVGEPHITGGKYKTFTNNPMEAGKKCTDYHYSTCPGVCVAKCISSSCSEPDENGAVAYTSDCDGEGSCIAR